MTTARDIMTPNPTFCPDDTTASDAARMMADDDDTTAVVLHTSGDKLFADAGFVPIADDQDISDAMLAAARQRLGAEAYDDAVRTGRALDVGDAIERARRVLLELST